MSEDGPAGSVVIPAWNEASVIGRTLDALFDGIPDGALEVVVACNGCTDGTAEVARRSGHPVTVLELPAVGKARAIRAAEDAATRLPRIYLDADTELPGRSALAVLAALDAGAAGARPPAVYDTGGATWPVRAFVAVREAMPGLATELYGAGVYGLSESARASFAEFPDVIADDLFAARIVPADQVVVPDVEPVVVRVPRDSRSLVSTLARVRRGNRQLAALMPDVAPPTTAVTTAALVRLARDPRRWPRLCAYVALVGAARVRARREVAHGTWERDHSARGVGATA